MTIPGGVRAIAGKATGRFYFEAVHQYGTSPGSAIGVADATASKILGLGADTHGYGVYPSGAVYHSGISVGSVTPFGLGDTVGVAVDVTSKLMWARVNAGVWNADPTADPGAGIGGISIAGISTVFPMCTVQAAAPASAFSVAAVHFDGATTVSCPALAAANSGDLSWSFWARLASPPTINTDYFISTLGNDIGDEHASTGSPAPAWPYVTGWGIDGGLTFVTSSTSNFPTQMPAATWVNVKVSLRTNFAVNLKTVQIWIGDTDCTSSIIDTAAAFQIPFNGTAFYVGAVAAVFPGVLFVGDLAEYWWAPGQFIDWSVEANRRKFISATGKPVNLGADGSTPLGVKPALYLHRAAGADPSTFANNLGADNAFSVTAGGLTAASTSPSD